MVHKTQNTKVANTLNKVTIETQTTLIWNKYGLSAFSEHDTE